MYQKSPAQQITIWPPSRARVLDVSPRVCACHVCLHIRVYVCVCVFVHVRGSESRTQTRPVPQP